MDFEAHAATTVGGAYAAAEAIKRLIPWIPNKATPLVALIAGVVISTWIAVQNGWGWQRGALSGLVAGLSATGIHENASVAKKIRKRNQPDPEEGVPNVGS